MLAFILKPLLSKSGLTPAAIDGLAKFFEALPPAISKIKTVSENDDLEPAVKERKITNAVAHFIDDALDGIPEWRDLPEAKRDEIVKGLRGLTLFFVGVADKKRH